MTRATVVDGAAPGYYGVYPALVTKLVPESGEKPMAGQVQVSFPWLGNDGDPGVRAWATLCSPYADDDQGLEILPEVGSQVVVAFEGGNLRRPYILGSAWHGKAKLPHDAEKPNNIRVLKTRGKSQLEFDDSAGKPKVTLSTNSGHKVVLDDGDSSITIHHSGGSVITIESTGTITIDTKMFVQVKALKVDVTAPMSTFSGVVKAQSVIADSFVVSPAYSPGVGNLL